MYVLSNIKIKNQLTSLKDNYCFDDKYILMIHSYLCVLLFKHLHSKLFEDLLKIYTLNATPLYHQSAKKSK